MGVIYFIALWHFKSYDISHLIYSKITRHIHLYSLTTYKMNYLLFNTKWFSHFTHAATYGLCNIGLDKSATQQC